MTGIPTTMTIEPIEADGKWWVDVSASGHQLMRLGPYSSASRAQNKAAKLTRKYQPKGATKGAAKASAAPVSAVVPVNHRERRGEPGTLPPRVWFRHSPPPSG